MIDFVGHRIKLDTFFTLFQGTVLALSKLIKPGIFLFLPLLKLTSIKKLSLFCLPKNKARAFVQNALSLFSTPTKVWY